MKPKWAETAWDEAAIEMKYSERVRFFEEQIENLGGPFVMSLDVMKRVLTRCTSPEGDEACRIFAATRHWPPMNDETRLEVCLRLECARDWCVTCGEARVDPHDENEQDFLKELLLDYCNDGGRTEWIYETLVRPDRQSAARAA